jgi:arylsulfatase A-like enzyme
MFSICTRFKLPIFLALLLACGRGADIAAAEPGEPAQRPNIVLILVDDMGYADLGVTGGDIGTPNIDRLANEGLFFSQFYNNAKCSQTRASLLSGLYYQQARKEGPSGNLGHDQLARNNNATLAEVLKAAGYSTAMAGKWHLGGTPYERGFENFYGYLEGAHSHWDASNVFGTYAPGAGSFYSTDAFTDAGIAFIEEAASSGRPVFLYLAYTAPHYPLHAPAGDVVQYRGRFDGGWDTVRDRRVTHMQEARQIPPGFSVADRLTGPQRWDAHDDGWIWDELGAEARADQAALMEVYAAMVHGIDRNVGRLLDALRRLGLDRNTLVFFLSDNGGSPYPNHDRPEDAPGPPGTWRTLNTAWANVNSAPFRLFKRYAHEGGIATPMIAWWPGGLVQPGRTTDAPFHVIDFMPTLVELTGAEYPATRYGDPVLPMAGRSFAPLLRDEKPQFGRQLFWEYQENYAVRDGSWKLVQSNLDRRWELYDLVADRGETNDLAATHPDIAERMKVRWQAWMAAVSAHRAFTDRDSGGR